MKKQTRLVLLICYSVFLCVFFGFKGISFGNASSHIKNGKLNMQPLAFDDFETTSIIKLDSLHVPLRFLSTDVDPRLIYSPDMPFYASSLTFHAKPSKPPGTIILYYTTTKNTEFSEKNKLWAKGGEFDEWTFDLQGKEYTSLRLDPDSVGGIFWDVERISLNDLRPSAKWFLPSTFEFLCLIVFPLFAAAFILELIALACPLIVFARKKLNEH